MQIGIQSPAIHSPGLQGPAIRSPGLQSPGNGPAGPDNHVRPGSPGSPGSTGSSDRGERLIARLDTGSGQVEQALIAKFADLLAEKLPPPDPGADIAKALLARLDADDSGALNSEEIAGTRLAQAIGSDFYELDSDRNGALDKAELSAFITDQYLGSAQEGGESDEGDDGHHEGDESDHEGDERDEGDDSDERDEGMNVPLASASGAAVEAGAVLPANDPTAAAVQPVTTAREAAQAAQQTAQQTAAQSLETTSLTSSQAAYPDQVRASLEAALAFLQKGSEQNLSALDVVRTLYAQANGTLGSSGTRL